MLRVEKQNSEIYVNIKDESSDVTLPRRRWARLIEVMSEVDEAVISFVTKHDVKFQIHIGGRWFICVKTPHPKVDIRQYFYNPEKGPSPSKYGIGLQLSEWNALKVLIPQLYQDHPMLTNAQTCNQLNHKGLQGTISCTECNPFQYDELLHSIAK
jgi:hypothetical protein